MNRILILFAHPSQPRSEVNMPLFEASKNLDGVTAIDLYAEYPTFNIDINREQRRLTEHDTIIFMFPLYWYSTPAILKEWQDLVLEYGFAYGEGGTALKGKNFLCSITAGGSEKGYQHGGYNHFTVREILQPLEQTANFTHMEYLPPFVLFGARTALEENRLACHIENWTKLLTQLRDNAVDVKRACEFPTLNEYMLLLKGDK